MLLCIYHVDDDDDDDHHHHHDVLSCTVFNVLNMKSHSYFYSCFYYSFLMFFNNNILVGANDAQHPTSC